MQKIVTATEMYGDCVTILIVRIVYGFFCAYDVRTTIFSPNAYKKSKIAMKQKTKRAQQHTSPNY